MNIFTEEQRHNFTDISRSNIDFDTLMDFGFYRKKG